MSAVKLLMGNDAMAYGALHAGVGVVTGYPGTPSSEVLQVIAKNNPGDIYVEWSANEKVAMEVAAGAAYAGVRSLVTMKQVGLNVAADPLMSLVYIGVEGGMVVLVADDPGPISSQTEQDTRHFSQFAKLPVFDPSSPGEAYTMIQDAFAFSEKHKTPVIMRPTTRVCHSRADIEITGERKPARPAGFVKNPKWVIFPKMSYQAHLRIEAELPRMAEELCRYGGNKLEGSGSRGIAAGGISYAYTKDALDELGGAQCKLLKIATANPFPEELALEFLDGLDEVLVQEELDPVIERELLMLCGRHGLNVKIRGKLTGDTNRAGENDVDSAKRDIAAFLDMEYEAPAHDALEDLPKRPAVLCAGCPHRASFYAVKQAMGNRKTIYTGDIGCYTLGVVPPLDMVDTCLCMGGGITVAQGLQRTERGVQTVAFVGDSTFFHSGMTGVVNAVYNQTNIMLVVLDNSTTAMTGQQPHPGTGGTMMGRQSTPVDIVALLTVMGVRHIETADPLNQESAAAAVSRAASAACKGISAVVFESPCISLKPKKTVKIDIGKCTGCMRCMRELGCPAHVVQDNKVVIDSALCYGCGLCVGICPAQAIGGAADE